MSSTPGVNVTPAAVAPARATPAEARKAYTRPSVRPSGDKPKLDLRQGLTLEYLQEALTTRVGKAVEEKLAAQGVDLNDAVGVDVSPEATADRIFRGTTSLLATFARQNPKLSQSDLVDKFETTIRGAIKKGYNEAVHILEGFQEFDDKVRGLVQQTQDVLDKKLDTYFADLRSQLANAGSDTATTAASVPATTTGKAA
ncbi:MAG: DUF5610 domain-containing protein [Myxococcota bacterium]